METENLASARLLWCLAAVQGSRDASDDITINGITVFVYTFMHMLRPALLALSSFTMYWIQHVIVNRLIQERAETMLYVLCEIWPFRMKETLHSSTLGTPKTPQQLPSNYSAHLSNCLATAQHTLATASTVATSPKLTWFLKTAFSFICLSVPIFCLLCQFVTTSVVVFSHKVSSWSICLVPQLTTPGNPCHYSVAKP